MVGTVPIRGSFCPVRVSQHSLAACELFAAACAHLLQDKMQVSRENPLKEVLEESDESNGGCGAVSKPAFHSMSFHSPCLARQRSALIAVHLPSKGDKVFL